MYMVKCRTSLPGKSSCSRSDMAKYYELEAEDFLARAIQHEIDHLHGVLFTVKLLDI